jgi:hypothetical protein
VQLLRLLRGAHHKHLHLAELVHAVQALGGCGEGRAAGRRLGTSGWGARAACQHPPQGQVGARNKGGRLPQAAHQGRRVLAAQAFTRPGCPRLCAEAVPVGGHLDGQLRFRQDAVHADTAQRDLGGAGQAQRRVLDAVDLREGRRWGAAACRLACCASRCHVPTRAWMLHQKRRGRHPAAALCQTRAQLRIPVASHLRVLRAGLEAALFKHRLAHEVWGDEGGEARRHAAPHGPVHQRQLQQGSLVAQVVKLGAADLRRRAGRRVASAWARGAGRRWHAAAQLQMLPQQQAMLLPAAACADGRVCGSARPARPPCPPSQNRSGPAPPPAAGGPSPGSQRRGAARPQPARRTPPRRPPGHLGAGTQQGQGNKDVEEMAFDVLNHSECMEVDKVERGWTRQSEPKQAGLQRSTASRRGSLTAPASASAHLGASCWAAAGPPAAAPPPAPQAAPQAPPSPL